MPEEKTKQSGTGPGSENPYPRRGWQAHSLQRPASLSASLLQTPVECLLFAQLCASAVYTKGVRRATIPRMPGERGRQETNIYINQYIFITV